MIMDEHEYEEDDADSNDAFASYEKELLGHGTKMTHKIPPAFDGDTSWFAFEEVVDDWITLTSLDRV